jgi:hypothetical protein
MICRPNRAAFNLVEVIVISRPWGGHMFSSKDEWPSKTVGATTTVYVTDPDNHEVLE